MADPQPTSPFGIGFGALNYWCFYHGGLMYTKVHWMQDPEYARETINCRELDALFLESISKSMRSLARAKIYSLREEFAMEIGLVQARLEDVGLSIRSNVLDHQ